MKIEIIQMLRLIASIGIFIYHTGTVGEKGFFGVELFFIISGFIMMYSTGDKKRWFLSKRMIRIWPLYIIATLAMYAVISIYPALSVMSEGKPEYLLKSLFFIPFENGYGFDVPVLGCGWTLNYEIYFYLIFKAAMMINHRHRMMISSGMILLLVGLGQTWGKNVFLINYVSDPIMLEFVMGMIAYELYNRFELKKLSAKASKPLGSVICLSLFILLWSSIINESWPVNRVWSIGPVALLLFMAALTFFSNTSFPSWANKLAAMSYSFFLVEYFTSAIYKVFAAKMPGDPLKIIWLLACLAITFIISYVSYKLIEEKMTKRLLRCLK